jgi:hypothetical protein
MFWYIFTEAAEKSADMRLSCHRIERRVMPLVRQAAAMSRVLSEPCLVVLSADN